MFMRIVTQPAAICRLGNARTRLDRSGSDLFLAGNSNQECVQVAICLRPGEPWPAGDVTLLGAIVNLEGGDHPYSLQGQDCIDGVFSCTFAMPSDSQREVCISLHRIMVVSCAQNKWSDAMAAKRMKLGNLLPDSPQKLTAQTVKRFRMGFFMAGLHPVVTQEILSTGQAGASTAAPVHDIVVDTLPAELCNTGTGTSHKVAILLGDSVAESATIRNVTCAADCKDTSESISFDCQVLQRIKHLVIVQLKIPDRLADLLTHNRARNCWLTVVMETGGVGHSGRIALSNSCDRCNSWTERETVPAPEYRRKQPTGGSAQVPQQECQQLPPIPAAPPVQLMPLHPAAPSPVVAAAWGYVPTGQLVLSDQLADMQLPSADAAAIPPPPPPHTEADQGSTGHPSVGDRHARRDRDFDEWQFFNQSLLSERLNDMQEIIQRDSV